MTLLDSRANRIEVTRKTIIKSWIVYSSWLTSHKATLCILKTKYIIFSLKSHNMKSQNQYANKDKDSVADEAAYLNYLGLDFRNNLGWKSQMQPIILKLRICCGIIYRIRQFTNVSSLLALYRALATKFYDFLRYYLARCKCCSIKSKLNKSTTKFFGVFLLRKFFKVGDVDRNYAMLQVNGLFIFYLACFVCLLALKIFL